ncbi:MAG: hypothetical protein IJ551_00485 [Prevotella sp.]|nr:hypothetical protein [Prevotella sp.]
MNFAVLCIGALVLLGIIAAIASYFQGGNEDITIGHDCNSCTSADDGSCKLHCMMEEQKKKTCAEPQSYS